MTKDRGTPSRGPWRAESRPEGDFIIYDAAGRWIALALPADGDEAANARLLRAAPELLAELKNLRAALSLVMLASNWASADKQQAKDGIAVALAPADQLIAKIEGRIAP